MDNSKKQIKRDSFTGVLEVIENFAWYSFSYIHWKDCNKVCSFFGFLTCTIVNYNEKNVITTVGSKRKFYKSLYCSKNSIRIFHCHISRKKFIDIFF